MGSKKLYYTFYTLIAVMIFLFLANITVKSKAQELDTLHYHYYCPQQDVRKCDQHLVELVHWQMEPKKARLNSLRKRNHILEQLT